MHLCTTYPFRLFWDHPWRYFADGLKRECRACGREEWVMRRPYPAIGEPQSYWENMSRKPFI